MAVPIPEPGSRGEVAALGVLGPEIRCSSKREQDHWLKSLLLAAEQTRYPVVRDQKGFLTSLCPYR